MTFDLEHAAADFTPIGMRAVTLGFRTDQLGVVTAIRAFQGLVRRVDDGGRVL